MKEREAGVRARDRTSAQTSDALKRQFANRDGSRMVPTTRGCWQRIVITLRNQWTVSVTPIEADGIQTSGTNSNSVTR